MTTPTTPTATTAPLTKTAAGRTRLPVAIYVLTAGAFLMGTSEFIVAGVLPEMGNSFGVTTGQAGLAISVFAVGMVIGPPTMVIATLRVPRKITLGFALTVFAAGHLVAALTGSYELMLVARFITGVATGTYWGVASSLASDIAGPAARARALGIVLGAAMLANVVGVPLGSWSGQLSGWQTPFYALTVLAVLALPALWRFVPAIAPTGGHPSIRAELGTLKSINLWLTLAVCACVTAGVISIYSYLAPLLIDRTGLDAAFVPVALGVFGAASLLGTILGGRLGDAHPFRVAFLCGAITLAAAIMLLIVSPFPAPTIAAITLLGLAGFSANPIYTALAVGFGRGAALLASAMPTSMFNLGTAVGTAVTGAAIASPLGITAPLVVGVIAATLLFLPLGVLAHRVTRAKRYAVTH